MESHILNIGGVFSMVTHLKLLLPQWKEKILESFLNGWSQKGRDPQLFKPSLEHFRNEHIHTSLPQIFGWLNSSDYRFYDCTYRRFIFGVVVAVK